MRAYDSVILTKDFEEFHRNYAAETTCFSGWRKPLHLSVKIVE